MKNYDILFFLIDYFLSVLSSITGCFEKIAWYFQIVQQQSNGVICQIFLLITYEHKQILNAKQTLYDFGRVIGDI